MESESDVVVGVTLEVRLHRFEESKIEGRESRKNRMVGKARRESESDVDVGVTLEIRLHRLKKMLKWR